MRNFSFVNPKVCQYTDRLYIIYRRLAYIMKFRELFQNKSVCYNTAAQYDKRVRFRNEIKMKHVKLFNEG